MKQQLPAKYAKMTVCTFWILKELKSLGMLNEDQMMDASKHFQLSQTNEDQMLFFRDLVENFDEHEKYLKMFSASNRIQMEEEDTKVSSSSYKNYKKEKTQKTEMDLINDLLESESDSGSESEQPVEKPKIKLIIKKK